MCCGSILILVQTGILIFLVYGSRYDHEYTKQTKILKNVWMQRTTQRRIKLLDLSVAGSLVKEILVRDVTLSVDKTKLIARLVLRQKGKIYWPIFQLAELVFFRASTM